MIDESGRDASIFSQDLALLNMWRLPHPYQIVTELPQEPRTLDSYMQILCSLLNTMCILTGYARLMPKPLVPSKDKATGLDFVQQSMSQIKGQVRAQARHSCIDVLCVSASVYPFHLSPAFRQPHI